jgi:Tol biopolymer transport system component
MKIKLITLMGILMLAVLLAACDSSTTTQTNTTATTGTTTTGAPGAQRPAQAGASGTLAATATRSAGSAAAQATPQASNTNTSDAPTAVPIPVIAMPTPVASASASTPATSSAATTTAAQSSTTGSTTNSTTTTPVQSVAAAITLADLKGKIIFFSDRDGGYAQLYMMNADGSNQRLCNCSDLLQTVVNTEVTSPDKQQFLYVTTVGGGRAGGDIQIWRHNNANNTDEPVTGGAPGFPGVDYDPAWSPDSRHIAWVTEVNGADEIYLYDAIDNSNVRLTQSSGEWYKHPSFSPDGSHIVYWTNIQNAEKKQIWIMKLDGSGKTNLSNNNYNDWDPIYVK